MPLRIATLKQEVVWEGAFHANHSLAHVNRELTKALLETGRFDFSLREVEDIAPSAAPDSRFDALLARQNRPAEGAAVTVRHFWPPDFRTADTNHLVVIQPWEFGSLPAHWIAPIAENVSEVWVPSRYVRETYTRSGVPESKVYVVPNGVDTTRFHPEVTPRPLPTKKAYKFLFLGGTIARKGIDVLLEAYTRAFTAHDDVTLVIKDFGTASFYQGQHAADLIAALQQKPNAPEILYLNEELSEADVAGLYAACDCLVHPYRGEGYGLPIAEAMATGKPTVITNHGAALDFAHEGTSYLINATPTRLATNKIGEWVTVDTPSWAEPSIEHLTETLRQIANDPQAAANKGKAAAVEIAAKHTWRHATEIAAQRLQALANAPADARKPLPDARKPLSDARTPLQEAVSPLEEKKLAAIALVQEKRWKEAIDSLKACLAEDPNDAVLLNPLGFCYHQTGNRREAKHIFHEGIRRFPDVGVFRLNLVDTLLADGDAQTALHHALNAVTEIPGDPDLRAALVRARESLLREARRTKRHAKGKKTAVEATQREMIRRADDLLQGIAPDSQKEASAASNVTRNSHKAARKARLSVVMIVKNEEKFLADCLASVRNAADEIILVDTGSTDSTLDIAARYDAKIFHHVWNDDFSEARNVSLKHATGDWALWIDADERLAPGEEARLRDHVENSPAHVGAYMVNICNFLDDAPNPTVNYHRACRLFRRLPGLKFTGRVHEQNLRQIQESGYACAMTELTLNHYGYAEKVMQERNKHERFLRMLHREVEENPDETYKTFHRFNLANAYFTLGKMREAAHWFALADENPDPKEEYTALLYVEWATALYTEGLADEALTVCAKADALDVRHPGVDFARGHALLHKAAYADADAAFVACIEEGKRGAMTYMGDTSVFTYKAVYGRALAAMGRDRYAEVVAHCEAVLAERNDFDDARFLLADALVRLEDHAQAVRALEVFLAKHPNHSAAKTLYADALTATGDDAKALPIWREITTTGTPSPTRLAKRGDCCLRLGLLDEAQEIYEKVCEDSPHSVSARINLGRILAAQGKQAAALELFTDCILQQPENANAYFNTGDLLYTMGYYGKAAEVLCAGLEREPTNVTGFFVLGNCFYQAENYEAASLAYREALTRRPDYAEAESNLALSEEARKANGNGQTVSGNGQTVREESAA